MNSMKSKLETLCVFRDFLKDPVIEGLCRYLEKPSEAAYSEFVALLYEYGKGDLGEYIKTLCSNSTNVYVRLAGMGQSIPPYMKETLLEELSILGECAALTKETLCAYLDYEGFLPSFQSERIDLQAFYLERIENIGRYGYGIYATNHMFYVDEDAHIRPVLNPDGTRLSELMDYERERKIVLDNTKALLAGKPAANVLLTGDAGTGKSSTVKAVANELYPQGLRIIEIRKDQLKAIPKVLDELSGNPLKFVLFIDDLSFLKDDDNFNAIKAVLEGSVTAKAANVVIYATSNRRHIIKEKFSDREGDDIHRNDTMQELVSLSERFGIQVTFSKPNKATYLNIVHHLAEAKGVRITDSELELLAERFALERGGRSARLANQFIDGLLSVES